MRKFHWPWRASVLDAAGKEKVRNRLSEIDFELREIMADVARVSVSQDRQPRADSFTKAASSRRETA
ncbi:MAG TPA: hypothetical protein PKD49_00305 [Hyphomicrobium sp.]|nr:hypothetical protein [Hyphomicrobium sp.]